MTDDELETLLRAWGRYFGHRHEDVLEEGASGSKHALVRAMEFAPGKRTSALQAHLRAGFARRRLMAADISGMRILPAHFVDPIKATETRPAVFGLGEISRPVPAALMAVQRACLDLIALTRLPGLCVQTQYCGERCHQNEKAEHVSDLFGEIVGLRRYREALAEGRGFMRAELVRLGGCAPKHG